MYIPIVLTRNRPPLSLAVFLSRFLAFSLSLAHSRSLAFLSMDSPPRGVPQYLTDRDGNHFHRIGSKSPWVPMPPRNPPSVSIPAQHTLCHITNVSMLSLTYQPLATPSTTYRPFAKCFIQALSLG